MEDVYNQVQRYEFAKTRLASEGVLVTRGGKFCVRPENSLLILKFLEQKEEDFRDTYGRSQEARIRNAKTLYKDLTNYLSNVDYWFNHKPFTELTEDDIRKVYRELERQIQSKMDALETKFLKALSRMNKEDAKRQLTPDLVKKFTRTDSKG